jgi:hypothetical protein
MNLDFPEGLQRRFYSVVRREARLSLSVGPLSEGESSPGYLSFEKSGTFFETSIHDFREHISEARCKHADDLSLLPKMPLLPQTRDIDVSLPATPTGSVF